MAINQVFYNKKTSNGIETQTLIDLTSASSASALSADLSPGIVGFARDGSRCVGSWENYTTLMRSNVQQLIRGVTNTSYAGYPKSFIPNGRFRYEYNNRRSDFIFYGTLNVNAGLATNKNVNIAEIAMPANKYTVSSAYINYSTANGSSASTSLLSSTNTELSGGGSGYSLRTSNYISSIGSGGADAYITISFVDK